VSELTFYFLVSTSAVGTLLLVMVLTFVIGGVVRITRNVARDCKSMDYKTQCDPKYWRIHFYLFNLWFVIQSQIAAEWNGYETKITFKSKDGI
jgi:hypothetical protein